MSAPSTEQQLRYTGEMSREDPLFGELADFADALDQDFPSAVGRLKMRKQKCGLWIMHDGLRMGERPEVDVPQTARKIPGGRRSTLARIHAGGEKCDLPNEDRLDLRTIIDLHVGALARIIIAENDVVNRVSREASLVIQSSDTSQKMPEENRGVVRLTTEYIEKGNGNFVHASYDNDEGYRISRVIPNTQELSGHLAVAQALLLGEQSLEEFGDVTKNDFHELKTTKAQRRLFELCAGQADGFAPGGEGVDRSGNMMGF